MLFYRNAQKNSDTVSSMTYNCSKNIFKLGWILTYNDACKKSKDHIHRPAKTNSNLLLSMGISQSAFSTVKAFFSWTADRKFTIICDVSIIQRNSYTGLL